MTDWETLYQTKETGWDRGQVSPALQQWLETGALSDIERILVPGCGRGYEVIRLAQLGHDVTGIDIAPSAIQALDEGLRAADAKATAVCTDLFSFYPEQPFDLVYEQTCLCAIEPHQRSDYEQQLWQWLTPGGTLLFSMMQTGEQGGPPYHCELMEMRALFHEQRWQWEEKAPFVIPRGHKSGRFELGFTLIKKGEQV